MRISRIFSVSCLVSSVLIIFQGGLVVLAHSGGTDVNGCHAGSQPYHCHSSSGGSSTAAPTTTTAAPTTTTAAPTTTTAAPTTTTAAPTTTTAAPTTTTAASTATAAPTTVAKIITCVKGKLFKNVRGPGAKCPKGWKKK